MKNLRPTKSVVRWMPCPKIEAKFPGLAYIYPLNELIVAKKSDAHREIGKKEVGFTIFNNEGQQIFLAVREKTAKWFQVKIFNIYGNEVIDINKGTEDCVNRVEVWAPPGNFVGYVKQGACRNSFLVHNKSREEVLRIRAQSFFGRVYDVWSGSEKVGTIKKMWNVEALMKYDNFGVSFPLEMDVEDKAVLLGACFLIGYLKY